LFLPFLPMLPTQILLNNLLYDVSEMAISTDRVDEELLERPARWDTAFIRRFMSFFGSISSVYDFLTFAILLYVFHADPTLFHSGRCVESLATQTLVIFIIRTRRVPFFRSAPSLPLAVTTGACLAAAVALPFSPLAGLLGFTPLPARFLAALALMVVTYLALAQAGIAYFFRQSGTVSLTAVRHKRERRVHRLASRWSFGVHPKRRAS
jgi:P-type Mg2+ transporter